MSQRHGGRLLLRDTITIVSLDLQAMNWNLLLCLIQSLSLNLLNKFKKHHAFDSFLR